MGLSTQKVNHSCTAKCLQQLVSSNGSRKESVAIFFDLRKAFDHRYLVDKLTLADLNTYILGWVISYLCNRRQYVVLNRKKSSTSNVISGVPPGICVGTSVVSHNIYK